MILIIFYKVRFSKVNKSYSIIWLGLTDNGTFLKYYLEEEFFN